MSERCNYFADIDNDDSHYCVMDAGHSGTTHRCVCGVTKVNGVTRPVLSDEY